MDPNFEGTVRFLEGPLSGLRTRDESLRSEHRGKILFVVRGVVLATPPLGDDEHAVIVRGDFAGDRSDSEIREDELYEAAVDLARRRVRRMRHRGVGREPVLCAPEAQAVPATGERSRALREDPRPHERGPGDPPAHVERIEGALKRARELKGR